MALIWAGTDIGRTHHHCVVLDADGTRLLSRRVLNDEPELLALLVDVTAIDEDVVWAVDVADGMAALWINLLLNHGQQFVYIPGLAVNRAAAGYRGTGKTDAKDATVIADQARMRRDLTTLRSDEEHALELCVLTGRRADISADRTRRINRLRGQLTSIFPALERELDLGNAGPLVLLTGYQTPAALRRAGRERLETRLRNRKVRGAESLAQAVLDAAAFDDVAASVGGAVEAAECRAASSASVDLVGAFGHDAPDAAFSQVGADLAGRVALVAGHPVGPGAGPAGPGPLDGDAGHDRLELRAVVDVPARDREGKRPALPVAGEVDLRAQPAAGPAECLTFPEPRYRLRGLAMGLPAFGPGMT